MTSPEFDGGSAASSPPASPSASAFLLFMDLQHLAKTPKSRYLSCFVSVWLTSLSTIQSLTLSCSSGLDQHTWVRSRVSNSLTWVLPLVKAHIFSMLMHLRSLRSEM